MNNAHLQMRIWKLDKPMTELARNSDGDQLLFVHEGEGDLFCDYGHLDVSRRRLHRDPARHHVAAVARQADDVADDRGDQRSFHSAGQGHHRPPRTIRSGDARHAARRRRLQGPAGRAHLEGVGQAAQPALDRDLPVQSAGCGGLARRSERGAHQLARPQADHEPPRAPAAVGPHHLHGRPLRGLHLRAAAARERSRGAAPAVLPQQRRLRRDHLLSQGQLLQPRQHPSRHDDGASVGLHARPASQGVQRGDAKAARARPTRSRS